ncbi:3-hydroxyacyl-[acyl-carrier-protein] dehydratase FabZ [Candidatus Aerophobetes bacterium]|uniref:3-hydroxyacyl-[acyl-carrier-protein] dehydratase FabZ n=1 Tax=Aerophobetes bacterium TaxID=2030807 RepID=A0A2A4X6X3_UNCAE|nr:MAG: 3-hydroxyacyl-[acyl-carrier-protein] dehydratase FabZ [Candidatus Aerophobetes bacterium]
MDEYDLSRPVLDVKQVMKILPHRYPFLLVDKVVHLDLEKGEIVGVKGLTMNELFFQGHFPGAPIMPGVLIIEALAQAGGILIHRKGFQKKTALLLKVEGAKFRNPVLPGDLLFLHVTSIHLSARGGKVAAKAMVNNKLAAEAQISYALADMESV